MLKDIAPPLAGLIVGASTGIAIDMAVKIITPPALGAFASFGIKVGTTIVAGMVSSKISSYISANVESIIEQTTASAELAIIEN